MKTKRLQNALLFSSSLIAIIAVVFVMAYATAMAGNRTAFSGKGLVKEVNNATKKVKVYFTLTSKSAESVAMGSTVEVDVKDAAITKKNSAGKYVRIKSSNIAVGQELSINGTIRSDNSLSARKVVVENREFVIKGKLLTIDDTQKFMIIRVGTSNYKQKDYVNKNVTFHYNKETIFVHLGKAQKSADVEAKGQRIQVQGNLTDVEQFDVTRVYNPI